MLCAICVENCATWRGAICLCLCVYDVKRDRNLLLPKSWKTKKKYIIILEVRQTFSHVNSQIRNHGWFIFLDRYHQGCQMATINCENALLILKMLLCSRKSLWYPGYAKQTKMQVLWIFRSFANSFYGSAYRRIQHIWFHRTKSHT